MLHILPELRLSFSILALGGAHRPAFRTRRRRLVRLLTQKQLVSKMTRAAFMLKTVIVRIRGFGTCSSASITLFWVLFSAGV